MNSSSLRKDWSGKDTKPSKFTRASKAYVHTNVSSICDNINLPAPARGDTAAWGPRKLKNSVGRSCCRCQVRSEENYFLSSGLISWLCQQRTQQSRKPRALGCNSSKMGEISLLKGVMWLICYVISWSSINSISSGIIHEGRAQKWDLGAKPLRDEMWAKLWVCESIQQGQEEAPHSGG